MSDVSLDLKRIFSKWYILLVTNHKNGDLLFNDLNVTEQVVQDFGRLTELVFLLCIKEHNDCFRARCLDLDLLFEVVVSWHIDKLGINFDKRAVAISRGLRV